MASLPMQELQGAAKPQQTPDLPVQGVPMDPRAFSPQAVVTYFDECVRSLQDIPIEPFLRGCEEIKKLVCTWGHGVARS
jgi:hypothetical protein